jgi:glycosyltransferase involved in cell wall biosynthesis
MSLSVVILTLDEEKHIRPCLESIRDFGDEVLVFDSGSTDRTRQIALEQGARIETRPFDNYAAQRNAALEAASQAWVMFIDADERATAAVRDEVKGEISRIQNAMTGETLLWIPRQNYIFGKWIQHTGWSPDYQPRVLKRGTARFDPTRPVHELVIPNGNEYYLKQPLVHYNYDSLAQFKAKQDKYTQFEAQMLFQQGVQPRLRSFVSMPVREFVRRFIQLQGYRDGLHGITLSGLLGYYAFRRQVLLAQMWRRAATSVYS